MRVVRLRTCEQLSVAVASCLRQRKRRAVAEANQMRDGCAEPVGSVAALDVVKPRPSSSTIAGGVGEVQCTGP